MMRPDSLAGWLAYLETLHPKAIALGLDRVREVYQRMGTRIRCPVVTVGGTNGKGSTCAFIATMLKSAGYRVGAYSSPHLLRYNERVQIDGLIASDEQIIASFNAVESARVGIEGGTPIALTYFEFGTLAALHQFAHARLDALVLEVGLGGRLDAVNIVDPDVAVVTSVDFDHVELLGPTRESIGREKAGIFRAGRPAICGDADPPQSLIDHAGAIGAQLLLIGRDYRYVSQGRQWRYEGPHGARHGLPLPALNGAYQLGNAATALCALDLLRGKLPVSAGAIRAGLTQVELHGRFEVVPCRPTIVLDVAHNPQAARALTSTLGDMGFHPTTTAVFGMLADKDIAAVVQALKPRIDRWSIAPLPGPRGATSERLRTELENAGVNPRAITDFPSIAAALAAARKQAGETDRIVVFGSFLTVAAALQALRSAPSATHASLA
ncbi:MAG TPA: bifunctional tetrahydrofolate synthase/dihydrofolate synthase [Casimicrobiaceae bacterium]|nr:bifunctional tetrahydrofolate synthase/dihydrofolate synthase [Casimicrobiaceae bacterium]